MVLFGLPAGPVVDTARIAKLRQRLPYVIYSNDHMSFIKEIGDEKLPCLPVAMRLFFAPLI